MAAEVMGVSAAPICPSREARLLLDGLKSWLEALGRAEKPSPWLWRLDNDRETGSSVLLRALRTYCRELAIRVLWCDCRWTAGLLGGAFAEILQQGLVCGAIPGDSDGASRRPEMDRLAPVLKRFLPEVDWPQRVGEPLAIDRSGERSRLVEAVVQVVLRVARLTPLVVALEALEDADPLSLEILGRLLRRCSAAGAADGAARVLVVVSLKEDAIQMLSQTEDCAAGLREAERIETRGYTREDLMAVVRRLYGRDLSLSTREKLLRSSSGSALSVDWLLKSSPTFEALEAALDEDLHDVGKRLTHAYDRLGSWERNLVLRLSILGAPHSIAEIRSWHGPIVGGEVQSSVAEAYREGGKGIEERLRRLESGGWIEAVSPDAAGETHRYVIDPVVAREVLAFEDEGEVSRWHRWALELFTPAAQKSGRQALRALAHLSQGTHAGLGSGSVPCDVRPGGCGVDGRWAVPSPRFWLVFKALEYLDGIGCITEAIELAEEAVSSGVDGCTPNSDERARLQAAITQWLVDSGSFREAIDLLQRRLALPMDREAESGLWCQIGGLWGRLGERQDQTHCYSCGLSLVGSEASSRQRRKLLASQARQRLEDGDVQGCLELCMQVAALLRADGIAPEEDHEDLLLVAGEVHERREEFTAALECEKRLHGIYVVRGRAADRVRSLWRLARISCCLGATAEAERYLLDSVRLADCTGSAALLAGAWMELGHFHEAQSDLERAHAAHLRARDLAADAGLGAQTTEAEAALFRLKTHLGRFDDASRSLLFLLERRLGWSLDGDLPPAPSQAPGGRSVIGFVRTFAGASTRRLQRRAKRRPESLEPAVLLDVVRSLEAEGALSAALDILRLALNLPTFQSPGVNQVTALLWRGRLAHSVGLRDLGQKSFEQALDRLAVCPENELVVEAYLEVAAVLLRQGGLARAFEYTSRALGLLVVGGESAPSLDCNSRSIPWGLTLLAELYLEASDFHAARCTARAAVHVSRSVCDARAELAAWRVLARLALESGDERSEEECFTHAQSLDLQVSVALETVRLKLDYGWSRARRGEFVEAMQLARKGLDIVRAMGAKSMLDEFLFLVGAIELDLANPQGNFIRGLETLEQVLAGSGTRVAPRVTWDALRLLADVYHRRDRVELAFEYERRAQMLFDAHSNPSASDRPLRSPWISRRGIVGALSAGAPAIQPHFTSVSYP
jgi:tetratricopeptide (TPR) repeat protein